MLQRLGCRRIRTRGNNVHATCPDESSHSGGVDRRPSFGILINPDGLSPSNCRACGFHDSAEWIARTHGWADLAGGFRKDIEGSGYFHIPTTNRGIWDVPDEDPLLPPESSIEPYVGKVPQYVLDRGFTLETCKAWELGFDIPKQRLIFVVRDRLGRLRGISGRTLVNHPAKYLHYIWDHRYGCWRAGYGKAKDDKEWFAQLEKWKKSLLFYGESMVNWGRVPESRRDTIVLVEGHTDSMWLWQHRWVAMSVMGSSLSEAQAKTVIQLLPRGGRVVTLGDGDEGGVTMANSIRAKLSARVPCFQRILANKTDPQDLAGEQIDAVIAASQPVQPP